MDICEIEEVMDLGSRGVPSVEKEKPEKTDLIDFAKGFEKTIMQETEKTQAKLHQ